MRCQPSLGLLTVNALTAAHNVMMSLMSLRAARVALLRRCDGAGAAQPRAGTRRHPRDNLTLPHSAHREVLARVVRGIQRARLPHGDRAYGVRFPDSSRRADHNVRLQLRRSPPYTARQGGAHPVPRRVSLPAAQRTPTRTGGSAGRRQHRLPRITTPRSPQGRGHPGRRECPRPRGRRAPRPRRGRVRCRRSRRGQRGASAAGEARTPARSERVRSRRRRRRGGPGSARAVGAAARQAGRAPSHGAGQGAPQSGGRGRTSRDVGGACRGAAAPRALSRPAGGC